MLLGQSTPQPRLGETPVARDRFGRHIEKFRDFVAAKAAEELQFYDFAFPQIVPREIPQGLIQLHQIRRLVVAQSAGFVEVNLFPLSAALLPVSITRVLDEDTTHCLRRDTAKVRAILPIDLTLVNQLEITLMHKGCGLKRMVGAFPAQIMRGAAAQLVIDQRQEPGGRVFIARLPLPEDLGRIGVSHGTYRELSGAIVSQCSFTYTEIFVPFASETARSHLTLMNYRSVRSRACWRIVFAFLAFSCAALSLPANAGVVTNTNDSGPGSLRRAIAAAAPGETITFAAGVNGVITLTSGSLVVNKNLTIQGPGAALLTVSGNNASVDVFTLDAAPIVMSGLTIANGKVGIVSPRLYQTTLSNLVIAQNRDGGIEAPAGGINVSDSTITANGGSGISVPNASIFSAFTVSVDRCTITYNHARSNGSNGGGLGGGIFVANGDAVVTNGTIAYNSSTSSPAGLDGDGGGILISDSGFIGTSGYAAISNCTIVNNSSDQGGGGIHLYDSQVDVTSCTIANNSSRDSNGAGITADTLSRVSLQNTIVARNNVNQNPSDIEAGFPVDGTSSYNLIGLGGSGGLVNGVNNNQVGIANPGLGSLGNNGGPTQTVRLTTKQSCHRRREWLRFDNRSTRLRPPRGHSENSKCRRRQRHWSIRG